MIEKIIAALRGKLAETLMGYEVYTEGVCMGAELPAVFIDCESSEVKPLLGDRYFIRHFVTATVIDKSDTKRKNTEEVTEKVMEAMKYVEAGGALHRALALTGKNDGTETVFRACYDVFPDVGGDVEERPLMEVISYMKGEN